ncbi:MAG: ABC transporter ATP-binding protein [Spirochaetia bacterium]
MIKFARVSKAYGDILAVDDLSFLVEKGKTTVLIGPSGCGKTTSLRMVNRMIEPTDGYVYVEDRPVKSFTAEELRRRIGYVIQSVGLLPHMSVRENIAIVPKLLKWSREDRYRRAEELLDFMGMDPEVYANKRPHELSGGEAQRIGVARALAADPPILLMDEPFGAVDPLNRESLQNEFIALQAKLKKTVLFVTHDIDEAIKIADNIVLLREGKLVQEDPPERLLARPKNEFVENFVGDDRALKRLACFSVKDYMRPTEEKREEKREGGSRRRGKVPPVSTFTSVRDALSRILGLGITSVPVLGDEGTLVGEIFLEDIEKLNQSGIDRYELESSSDRQELE